MYNIINLYFCYKSLPRKYYHIFFKNYLTLYINYLKMDISQKELMSPGMKISVQFVYDIKLLQQWCLLQVEVIFSYCSSKETSLPMNKCWCSYLYESLD